MPYLSLDQIVIRRDDRQRKEPDPSHIEELARSIATIGLINAITVGNDNELIAGECRYLAHKLLGFDQIKVEYFDDLDELQRYQIELEENLKRSSLSWQDEVEAVATFHSMLEEKNGTQSQEATAELLGFSREKVGQYLRVWEAMQEGVEEVIQAPQFSTARSFTERRNERRSHDGVQDLLSMGGVVTDRDPSQEAKRTEGKSGTSEEILLSEGELGEPNVQNVVQEQALILNKDFMKWSEDVQEIPFNLIHCDFPYGVNAGDKVGQSAAKSLGGYDDTQDIYWSLLGTFLKNQDNFCARSAHMIFWFSMKFYEETKLMLRENGWRVDDFPLIWDRGNNGILPDANRGPRRTYETALFCTRGDRKIVKAVANSIGSPVVKDYHMSEKPKPVLSHFFRMLIDDTTRLLDPTCGSGNAIVCGRDANAAYSLGLELNPEFAERANQNLKDTTNAV